jgi:hypothetical protein
MKKFNLGLLAFFEHTCEEIGSPISLAIHCGMSRRLCP